LSEFDIVITTYEILVSEVNYFRRRYVWTTIIVDEGHRLKNERSQLSEKLRIVPCLCKVILTGLFRMSTCYSYLNILLNIVGTPLQNNLKELWAMLYYLAPDVFTSSKPFEDGFDLIKGIIDPTVLRRARKLLCVFMLRRVKDQVDVQLPNRRELTILVPLTEEQKRLYKQLLCGLGEDVIEAVMTTRDEPNTAVVTDSDANESNEQNHMDATEADKVEGIKEDSELVTTSAGANDSDWRMLMNLLLQLRKVCNHTYLMPDIAPDPYEITGNLRLMFFQIVVVSPVSCCNRTNS